MQPRSEPETFVLDGYSLLTFLEGGPGGDQIRDLLEKAKLKRAAVATTVVNVGEVVSLVEAECGLPKAHTVLARLLDLPISRFEAGDGLALAAARYRSQYGLTQGDCYAAALARYLGGSVVTGNPFFNQMTDQVRVEWLNGVPVAAE